MFTGPARHGAPPRHARKRQAPERTVSKDNRDDLVGEVADAVTLDLDVRWDRCAERAAPADRRKIENLRVIERVFRSRPAAGEVSRTAPAGGADSRASAFVRRAVSALIAIAWAELGFSLLLLVWSWGSFYGTNGDLAVYLVTKLAGFGVGACLLLFAGGRERRTRALGLYCLLKATHASYAIIPAVLMDAPLAQMVPGWFLEVPVLPGYLLVPAFLFAPTFLWMFARECPGGHRRGRLDVFTRRMVPASAAIGCAIWIAVAAVVELARAGYAVGIASPLSDVCIAILDLMALAAAVAMALRARSAPVAEVKRLLVFGVGFVMCLGVATAYDVAEALLPGGWLSNYRPSPTVLLMELMRFPGIILLWYGVLATRIPYAREAVRAFCRWLLTGPGPLGAASTVSAALALLFVSRPEWAAGAANANRLAQALFAATGIVLLALIGRDRILRRLEDWIFTATADQRQVLAEAGAALSSAVRVESISQTVARAASTGSGSPAALLLAADPREEAPELRSPDSRIAPLSGTSAIVHLLDTVGGPLRVHPEHATSVFALLPPQEAAWVLETETDVIVPVSAPGLEGHGAVAVGRRLDGRIVRSVDVAFLEALGVMAGLALHRLSALDGQALPKEPSAAQECPACRSVAEAGKPPACECGQAYVEADVPKLLAGKFRLTRRLGTGGMGVAYLARDLRLDRDVAVKTLVGTSVAHLMQLKAEAWAMAGLTHPAVAQILGIEFWRGRPFLVVEFLAGGTLKERLLHGPVPPLEAMSDIAALADGLAALHERRFLHGDIKPSNIGFTSDGSPKLLDFGLARSTDDLADSGGTLHYVSPEVLSGCRAAECDDVWSLCVVLYEMVAGEHPFAGGGGDKAAGQIRRRRIVSLYRPAAAPGPAEPAIAFAAAVLSADRSARPATARAFAAALRKVAP